MAFKETTYSQFEKEKALNLFFEEVASTDDDISKKAKGFYSKAAQLVLKSKASKA
jgi:hypothetical protein